MNTSRPPQRSLARFVLPLLLAVATVTATGCAKGGDATLQGAVIDPLPDVSALSLPDANTGTPFTMKAEPGGILLMYFGYTHCPDVCPTSLAQVKTALRRIGEKKSDRVSLAFATVDPERDTGTILRDYVQSFVDDGVALRSTDESELRSVADAFGAQYAVTKLASGTVEVSHTGTLYAVDDTGHIAVQWPFEAGTAETDAIAHDLGVLLG